MITVESAMQSLYATVTDTVYKSESSYTTVRSYTANPLFQPEPLPFCPQAPLLRIEFQVDTLSL